jgi:threonyl-tRNA synthetase
MSQEIKISLPDGNTKILPLGSNGYDLAASIGSGLAKSAIAYMVEGKQFDLSDELNDGMKASIITIQSDEGLEIMRHTLAAQVLAKAIKNLYPNAKLAIGPTIETGFYYDILFEKSISSDDLEKIEDEMRKILKDGSGIVKTLHSKKDAISKFNDLKEHYKVKIIESSEQNEDFQIYTQEESGFIDLCNGPHLPSLKFIGEFKLLNLAGAYWKGDSKNEMLTRIYGTAWRTKKELSDHLSQIEEAEKRDHRKLAKEMNLFHFQDEAPGMVFWHQNGWSIYTSLLNFMREKLNLSGYQEINTPQVVDRKLWEASGHWEKYRENMFIAEIDEEHANEKRTNALKPMNCPCHVQVYNQGLTSYKDLPIRFSEFGSCHRYEASGTMHGLMRVRGFTQDDGHIFCTEDQIEDETKSFITLLSDIYKTLGFNEFNIKLSTRPEVRIGNDETWDKAENALQKAIERLDLPYVIEEGEGAFYGPKLDFVLTDAIGRQWQCGTFQADFILPSRLDAVYVGEDGKKHNPVMIHRAILGSFERFLGILIENYSGKLPLWLAPKQIAVLTVTDEVIPFAEKLSTQLLAEGIRVELDKRNEKIGYKIREHSNSKTQLMAIIGKKEMENEEVSIRALADSETETMSVNETIKKLKKLVLSP